MKPVLHLHKRAGYTRARASSSNLTCTRAVTNEVVLKYDQYSNLKGIISVRGKLILASLLRPQEQNITNARFFKAIQQHDYL